MPKDRVVPTHSPGITSLATGTQCYRGKKLFGLTFITIGSNTDRNREAHNYLELVTFRWWVAAAFPLLAVETKHDEEFSDCCFCAISWQEEITWFSEICSCMPKMLLITMNDRCKEQSHQIWHFLFVFSKPKGTTFIWVGHITSSVLWYHERKYRRENRVCMLSESVT